MIDRCLNCHSPIVPQCLCKQNLVRCPGCKGTGRGTNIELLEGSDGYMGYMTIPTGKQCEVCDGWGKLSVEYQRLKGEADG